ncbi:hypothetical protein DDZ14_18435 [Maritimibacter sp. 55A14]|nr:hypothetical protein DDZ14_18435 [Maritimibacter sp. 55A14]
MPQKVHTNPFHAGELEAQARAGAGDVASWAAGFIRDYLPEQHRDFHTSLPFFVIAAGDAEGRPWVTIVEGRDGFINSPNPCTLTLDTALDAQDPLTATLQEGSDIGGLGIDPATRRRNRLNGFFHRTETGFAIAIRQTFGNCPQYIHERNWYRVIRTAPPVAEHGGELSLAQRARITAADTMFIGTGHRRGDDVPSRGYDASHRGGAPGFVQIVDATHLRIPDYAGNNFFNTIGNLVIEPRIGLLFVDFETGGLLHVSGRAQIDWAPDDALDPGARRAIEVTVEAVVDRPSALSLRWTVSDTKADRLQLVRKVVESRDITSFHFSGADRAELAPFEAGQHLLIELQIPGQTGTVKRSYSLSGAPVWAEGYRLSVKRQPQGLVSRFLHDQLEPGDVIEARKPSGDFVVPAGECPLVLVSAGIGLTPMVSMLHAAVGEQEDRPVWFVHGTRNGASHALAAEVDRLVTTRPTAHRHVVYSRPEAGDLPGRDYDARGHISAESVLALNAGAEAHYMLCGPTQFISDIRIGLEAGGVPADRIHFESFGSHRVDSSCRKPEALVRPWIILLGLSLGVAVSNGFARFAYGLILPAMREDLDWTYTEAGWLNTANALGYLAGAALTLAIIRQRPAAWLFAVGIVGTSASLVLSGLTQSFWLLTIWRVFAGVFGAPTFIAGGVLAANLFPDTRRMALAIALYFGGGGIGIVLSGITLPLFFEISGSENWPMSWLGLGAVSALACTLSLWSARQMSARASMASGSGSGAVEPSHLPILRMLPALTGYGLFAVGYIVTITFLVAFMHDLAADAVLVSTVWVAMGLAIVASPFLWRVVLARFSNGVPLAAATFVTAIGTALPIVWSAPAGLVMAGAVFGVAVFIAPAAVTTFSRGNLPASLQASGIALFTVVFAAGQTIGPIAAGAIGDAFGSIAHGLGAAVAVLMAGALTASLQPSLIGSRTNEQVQ